MIVAIQKIVILVSLLWIGNVNQTKEMRTTVEGKVTDVKSGEPILLASVAFYRGGVLITGVDTDFDGKFIINDIQPGTYDVEASYVGSAAQRLTGVVILAGKQNVINFQ